MRRVYVLCLLTLTVVVLDILLFHTGPAARAQQAQPQPGFRVDRISFYQRNTETAPVYGRIVGFDCVANASGGPVQCFVASSIN
jgi:hypothetical protein